MYKRVFLLFAVFASCTIITYYVVTPNQKKQIKKALFYLKQNNYTATESVLKSLSNTSYNESFYRGYLEQVQGKFQAADKVFQACFNEAKRMGNQHVMQEILLARATNAYFEKRDSDFRSYIEIAHNFSASHPSLIFFEGLKCYTQNNYAEALQLWNTYSPTDVQDWMACSIEILFPETWKKLHIAHCLIEKGDIYSAREILEKECQSFSDDKEFHNLITLFLGLSYLKEAQNVAYNQRGSYYNMALFYFERTQLESRERDRIITFVEEEAKNLINGLDPMCCSFIHILQNWNALSSISYLSDHFAEKLVRCGIESKHFCEAMRHAFQGTSFYSQLTEKMLTALAVALQNGEMEDLFELWTFVESLHPHPKLAAREIASLTSEQIFETIKKDNLNLTFTRNYITFWEKLGRNAQEKELLAHELLFNAKLFWQNEQQEKKGQRLMEIALEISQYNPLIEKEITSFLTNLYAQAENSNMIRRLTLIYDAMAYFEINRQELVSKVTLANHLADAEYLYESHNYPSAKTLANWVLKLDPQNDGARRLIGLCAFNLGEYDKALYYLKELKTADEDCMKAVMLAQVFSTQQQGKHLCQIDAIDTFDDND